MFDEDDHEPHEVHKNSAVKKVKSSGVSVLKVSHDLSDWAMTIPTTVDMTISVYSSDNCSSVCLIKLPPDRCEADHIGSIAVRDFSHDKLCSAFLQSFWPAVRLLYKLLQETEVF